MLGEGLAAGLRHLGVDSRCILYAEREAYPVAVLEARMQEGSLAPAPIWFGDFTELDASRFRGVVDCIVAGFPCQDLSVAGRRAGLDGARSGLFYEVVRIATDSGAWCMLLENVAGIATATATVVDEEEGELEERAAARVVGELADLGWDAEWITLAASDVGASHGRARWFCLAWRVADTDRAGCGIVGRSGLRHGVGPACGDDADGCGGEGATVADPARHERPGSSDGPGGRGRRVRQAGDAVADATRDDGNERFRQRVGEAAGTGRQSRVEGHGKGLADPQCPRPQGHGPGFPQGGGELEPRDADRRVLPFFAPGPTDQRWSGILAAAPHLAPALEPSFRGVADGLEHRMDDCRAQRLKCIGNGVVAAQAAAAFVVLARRAGVIR